MELQKQSNLEQLVILIMKKGDLLNKVKSPKTLGRIGVALFIIIWTVTGSISDDGYHVPFIVFALTAISGYLIYRFYLNQGNDDD